MRYFVLIWMFAYLPAGIVLADFSENRIHDIRVMVINQQYEQALPKLQQIPASMRDLDYYLLVSQVTLALQQYEAAIMAMQRARGLAPDDLNLMVMLARTYRIAGQTYLAESLAETVLTRDEHNRQALIIYGGIQSEKGNWVGARRVYSRLVTQDSTNTFFRHQYAQALNQLNEKGNALIQLREANRLSPEHLGVLHDLIRINYEIGLYDIARTYAEAAVQRHPSHIPFRKRLAEIEFRERNFLKAANQYREVIQLGERTEANYRNLGMSYYFGLEYDMAIDSFESALSQGDDPNAHFYMAMSLNQLGQHVRAIGHLKKSADQSMGNLLADSYIQLGSIYDRTGNLTASIEHYQMAMKLRPDRLDILFYLASAYDRTGNHRTEARNYYREYLLSNINRDPTMENYARARVSRLTEEIHFRENR